jgi:hypothetical protein
MKPMNIEQIVQLMLRQTEEEAPPPPSMEWFRERLAARTVEPRPRVEPWLEEQAEKLKRAWEWLREAKPGLLIEVYTDGPSVGGTDQKIPALGVIPACLLLDKAVETSVEVIRKPGVSKEGRLLLRARVPESGLKKGAKVEITLLGFPEGNLIGVPLSILVGEVEQLAFELPQELQEAWRGVKHWDWSDLPFRFALRPLTETSEEIVEISEGEAAGSGRRRRLTYVFESIGQIAAKVHSILGVRRA